MSNYLRKKNYITFLISFLISTRVVVVLYTFKLLECVYYSMIGIGK